MSQRPVQHYLINFSNVRQGPMAPVAAHVLGKSLRKLYGFWSSLSKGPWGTCVHFFLQQSL